MMTERYMVLDLWMASGRDAVEFEDFLQQYGEADAWSLLLDEIRCKPRCGQLLDDGQRCVLSQHDPRMPHYGPDDVASPVYLPPARDHGVAALSACLTRLYEGWVPHQLQADGERWWWGLMRDPKMRPMMLRGHPAYSMSAVEMMTDSEVAVMRRFVPSLVRRG